MAHSVLVTGASGFVGSAVVNELLQRGTRVSALVRPDGGVTLDPRVTRQTGELGDAASLNRAMSGCDAVIHLVGIIAERPASGITFAAVHVEGTRNVISAARSGGVRRFVHMSALGTRADAVSDYHRTKWQAEELVRTSGLDWTIFRPSMIHGRRGAFTRQAIAWARKQAMPFVAMPYFGRGLLGFGGAGLLQPVFVDDVARAFVDALDRPVTIGRTYDLGGPDRYTWPEFYEVIARTVVGRRRATLPIPAWYARLLAAIVPRSLLPFNRDQVIMSQEDNVGDTSAFTTDFGWTPRPFEPTLRGYATEPG